MTVKFFSREIFAVYSNLFLWIGVPIAKLWPYEDTISFFAKTIYYTAKLSTGDFTLHYLIVVFHRL